MDTISIVNYINITQASSLKNYQVYIDYLLHFIVPLAVAWFAAYWALGRYFQGQKTERLQRIYYEDAIIGPLKSLDKLFSTINRNSGLFTCLNNYIGNKFEAAEKISRESSGSDPKETIFRNITSAEYIKEIGKKIKVPSVSFSSNDFKEILKRATNSDAAKYFSDWLDKKIKQDISHIMAILRNVVANYEDYLRPDQEYIELYRDLAQSIKNIVNQRNNEMSIIEKHTILLSVANQLKHILTEKSYKSKINLIKELKKDQEFLEVIDRFSEAFKILFLYYKVNGDYISYAKNEVGKNYKITFIEGDVKLEEIVFIGSGELESLTIYQEIDISKKGEFNGKNLHELLFEIAKPYANFQSEKS